MDVMTDQIQKQPGPVLLVGNYPLDGQESMQRFTDLMAAALARAGVRHEVIFPRPRLGRLLGRYAYAGLPKWLGYLDKYVVFPRELARRARAGWQVHIMDHSNAMYARRGRGDVVTCHDLLAVRGARGEVTDCPAGFTGRALQRWILRGLDRAAAVCCVSRQTAADAHRLLPTRNGRTIAVVPNALNYPFGRQTSVDRDRRLRALGVEPGEKFVLHVGSNLKRKNKAAILHAVARAGPQYDGRVVLAGPELSDELRQLARELGLVDRLRAVVQPDSATLEALYGGAVALLFPSRWEGFGWPIIEAQACGCPVVCGDQSALPEVAGEGAVLCGPDDHAAWARALTAVQQPERRAALVAAGRRNVERYSESAMLQGYLAAYDTSRCGANRLP